MDEVAAGLASYRIDAHVHLDFMANGEEVAYDAAAAGVRLLAATVTPNGFAQAREQFAPFENVIVGLGLHPWWVAGDGPGGACGHVSGSGGVGGRDGADALIALLGEARLVSEVGLDFGKRHAHAREEQLRAFKRIARACAEQGGKTLSLHAVHAAREVLDTLEESGALESCTCVFHWFSGPSDQLKRAIDAGCLFSVGERMLVTGKGREYVRAIPAGRLMPETDAPPQQGQEYAFADLRASLQRVVEAIALIKGEEPSGERLLPDM